jgi:endonuclease/exonuclease/phosphatase family metal-dependent hydrolase
MVKQQLGKPPKNGHAYQKIKVLAWNILAPSLTGNPESENTFSLRLEKMVDKFKLTSFDLMSFSEVDEFVPLGGATLAQHNDLKHGPRYFLEMFTTFFPPETFAYVYLSKPTPVAASIKARHGNLLLFRRSMFEILDSFPFTFCTGDKQGSEKHMQWFNQPANIVQVQHRATRIKLLVCSCHLKSGLSEDSEKARRFQIQFLRTHMDTYFDTPYKIWLGDFNQNKLELAGFVDAFADYCARDLVVRGGLLSPPCAFSQARVPALKSPGAKDSPDADHRLDYIFLSDGGLFSVSEHLYVSAAEFEANPMSDHYPLGCTIRLNLVEKLWT